MRILKIGRDASCDIVIQSPMVSSVHAELTLLDSGDMMIEDRGSHNGTFVMGQQIKPGTPAKVTRGDKITFGNVDLQWNQVPMPEDNSAYKGIYGIGSHFNNDIQVTGATVSRYHATVKQGRDGKFYIFDHSKNGTTVDGVRIPKDTPYRIKKKSAVVCGGVPVNLATQLPWPSESWKYIVGAVAGMVVLVGVGFGLMKLIGGGFGGGKEYSDEELYARYNTSIAMIIGNNHLEVTCGDLDLAASAGIPTKWVPISRATSISQEEINSINYKSWANKAVVLVTANYYFVGAEDISAIQEYILNRTSFATGFFVSQDGQLVTNLHVVKPWLFDTSVSELEMKIKTQLSAMATNKEFMNNIQMKSADGLQAYTTMVKVTGVNDGISIIPQAKYFSVENLIRCRVLSAGDDTNVDVALIQSDKGELPHGSTFINLKDSMDVNDNDLTVGTHIYTIGFPFGISLQKTDSEKGIQVLARGGSITQMPTEFSFGFDAASFGGASGSPIFNKKGMLVGVLNSGVSVSQGFNYGIKAKFVKELVENPHVVK